MKSLLSLIAAILLAIASPASASTFELSQAQMRQLVQEKQINSVETVIQDVSSVLGDHVMDVRAFFSEGRVVYRVLAQHNGQLVEVLIDGTNNQQVSHNSSLGKIVSELARSQSGSGGNRSSSNNSTNSSRQNDSSGNSSSPSNNGDSNSNATSNSNAGDNSNASSNSTASSNNNANSDNGNSNRGGRSNDRDDDDDD